MKCGLIGEKLGHSYSKIIHSYFGLYSYDLVELNEGELEQFVKSGELDAFNVTIPYKEKVIPFLDEIDEAAATIGAVNTVFRKNGKIYGKNTDFAGMKYMLDKACIDLKNKNVMILGSGGTSKTACAVARYLNANEITVVSRSGKVDYENCYELKNTQVVINTTPVGMYPKTGISPIDLSRFPDLEGVVDVIYNPENTALLMQAKRLGVKCTGGLAMLVAQAKYAMDAFTGKAYDDAIIENVYARLQKNTRNVVLIGMPGCGKSSIGKAVADKLNKKLVDMDEQIVLRAKMSISDMFEKYGEAHFRQIESEVACELGKQSGLVIATGGGVVINPDNYGKLKTNGVIIYIDRDVDKLATEGRPLSVGGKETLKKMFKTRAPMYNSFADITVMNNGNIEDCANKIVEYINENSCN